MGQDRVAALRRNGWPESIGISGRFRSESVAGFVRNTQLANWMGDRCRLRVDLDIDQDGSSPGEDVRILLFESTRELIFNAVKHAKVDSAKVILRQLDGASIQITVSDNGVGFDTSNMKRPGETGAGLGIFSIAERLSLIGGSLEIYSMPGQGSRFVLTAPMKHADAGLS